MVLLIARGGGLDILKHDRGGMPGPDWLPLVTWNERAPEPPRIQSAAPYALLVLLGRELRLLLTLRRSGVSALEGTAGMVGTCLPPPSTSSVAPEIPDHAEFRLLHLLPVDFLLAEALGLCW